VTECCLKDRQREKRKKWGGSEWEGGQETVSPVLKAPRQCPLVLLVEVMHMIGIVLFFDMTLEGLYCSEFWC
jgi:hypothetical protein